MNKRDLWFVMQELQIGGKTIVEQVQAKIPHLRDVESLHVDDFTRMQFPVEKARKVKQHLNEGFIAQRYELYDKQGIEIITLSDPHYPKQLMQIPDPPCALYVKGDSRLLHHPSIAVVGARRATMYGIRATRHLVAQLCAYGFGIVSGLARGIDTEAHESSLAFGAPSMAVLGTGWDVIYPKENRGLLERMIEQGVVVSETPYGSQVKKWMFAKRNRIISGLSLGTLVTEADENSGALQTAKTACDQNREVFMVPGSIFSPQSRGTIKWLKESSALPVTCGADIALQFQNRFPIFDHTNKKERSNREHSMDGDLSPDEREVLQHMTRKGVTIDELLAKTKFPFGHLHTVLLSLEIKKKILKQSGSIYSKLR